VAISPYKFRKAREKRRLSVSELAEITGLDRSVIYNIEVGKHPVRPRTWEVLAESLRVSPNDLLWEKA